MSQAMLGDEPLPENQSIRIGCAGWNLPAEMASRFSAEGSHVERYAQRFPSVEINSSFYRTHQPKTYARWAASVPDAFRFSVKMPRRISHELMLRDAGSDVTAFLHQVTPLGHKLGCLLLQLPPSLAFDPSTARTFFASLAGAAIPPVVCEPRHASWFTEEADETMRRGGVARVLADPSPVPSARQFDEQGRLYLRLHGAPRIYYSAYEETFIERMATRLKDAKTRNADVWCIFDNTARGAAVPNALQLIEKVQAANLQ